MAYEPRLITPFVDSGLKKYYKPWLIGDEAFPEITNAYSRRGVVRKREGYRLLAQLPLEGLTRPPVQGLKNWINPLTLGERLIVLSLKKAYLFDDTTQTFNDITTLSAGSTVFSFGSSANDYYWSSNYASSMWITNGLSVVPANVPASTNGILYWNGTIANGWNILQPLLSGTNYLNGALIVLPYKGYLVALNTLEGPSNGTNNINYQSRARWSQRGNPYVTQTGTGQVNTPPPAFAPGDDKAWRDDIPGRGSYIDADTSERIVSAGIVKDTLIVAFQRSTWRLRYTGNRIQPFIWERLNTQYGAESTHSAIVFDEAVLFFSRFGWIAATTNDVTRIDQEIPDDSFSIEGTNTSLSGLNKVQGIRDFYRNFVFWTFLTIGETNANQIYGYNYIDKSWTIFNPTTSINTFGMYRNTAGDKVWSSFNAADDKWENFSNNDDVWSSFSSGQNAEFPYTVGGDLNGNVVLMFEFFEAPTTDYNGTSQVNFNFDIVTKRFNPYIDQGHKCRLGYIDLYVTSMVGSQITVNHYVDDQDTPIITKTVNLFERGVFNITNVSVGTTTTITTLQDHELSVGEVVTISDIVGNVRNVLNNQSFIVGTIPTDKTFTIKAFNGTDINTTGLIYTLGGFVYNQDLPQGDATYTRVFLGAIGRMHQLEFTLSPEQLADPVSGAAQFELQGIVLWTRETGRIRG